MGNSVIENSKRFIKEKYPEVAFQETNSEIIFDGRFVIDARKGDFEIHEAPHLRIVLNKQYPFILPICYDADKKIKYDHVFSDDSLCVSTILDMEKELKSSISIQDFIEKFIIPYFLSYRYWQKTGVDLNEDRAHGAQGIFQSLKEYLFCELSNEELLLLLCWAAKIRKFKRCVPEKFQRTFLEKYLVYLHKLRFLGISHLRCQYRVLIKCIRQEGKGK